MVYQGLLELDSSGQNISTDCETQPPRSSCNGTLWGASHMTERGLKYKIGNLHIAVIDNDFEL